MLAKKDREGVGQGVLFFYHSLTFRRTPLSERLEQASHQIISDRRYRRSKRTPSDCVLCIAIILTGSPSECVLCISCILAGWRLGLRSRLVVRNKAYGVDKPFGHIQMCSVLRREKSSYRAEWDRKRDTSISVPRCLH